MTTRSPYLLSFLAISGILATSLYLQFFKGVIPCPLCTLQRLSFALLGILFFIGIFLNQKRFGRVFVNLLCSVASVIGIIFASRQIWLQQFPSADMGECGVSLQYMLTVLPLKDVVAKIFSGGTECAQRGWEFLHLSMAEWALIWFLGFLFLSLFLLVKEWR